MFMPSSTLQLYLDSADESEWRRYLPAGLFYGVTTNPKLLYQTGIPCTVPNLADLARTAFDLGAQEIHLQVWGEETESMLNIGREIADIDYRVSVKVPITREGILCARQLIEEGHQVTLTAVHSASQLLTAVALGAAYAAPYLGRMNDAGLDGLAELAAMQQMVRYLESPTRILAASIRQLSDLVVLAAHGLNTFTLLPKLVDELLDNPLTIQAAADFNEKARRGK